MKNLYLAVLFVVFVCLLSYCYNSGRKRTEIRDKIMLNDFLLRGEVFDIKESRNHNFGILLLKVRAVNIGCFVDTILKAGIFPYKIKGGKAEVYAGIPDGIQKGDEVSVDSDKKTVIYRYVKEDRGYEDYIGIIIDQVNIEYVKEQTTFK
jgi:hypothetical protein